MKQEPPQDIRERSFEFAARVVNLCKKLDASPGFLEHFLINCYALERR
ncbi:hypothetical protein [Rubritalea tangerina]